VPGLLGCFTSPVSCICVDPETDPEHCGATVGCGYKDAGSPGVACPSGEVCENGACTVLIPPDH
jgi:hypothetical protein